MSSMLVSALRWTLLLVLAAVLLGFTLSFVLLHKNYNNNNNSNPTTSCAHHQETQTSRMASLDFSITNTPQQLSDNDITILQDIIQDVYNQIILSNNNHHNHTTTTTTTTTTTPSLVECATTSPRQIHSVRLDRTTFLWANQTNLTISSTSSSSSDIADDEPNNVDNLTLPTTLSYRYIRMKIQVLCSSQSCPLEEPLFSHYSKTYHSQQDNDTNIFHHQRQLLRKKNTPIMKEYHRHLDETLPFDFDQELFLSFARQLDQQFQTWKNYHTTTTTNSRLIFLRSVNRNNGNILQTLAITNATTIPPTFQYIPLLSRPPGIPSLPPIPNIPPQTFFLVSTLLQQFRLQLLGV